MRAIGLALVLVVTGLSFAPDPSRAGGLIQSLPADGAWVRYNFRCRLERGGSQKELIGDLTIKSVGAVQHDGRPHRWIETVLDCRESTGGGERREIEKMLFPEAELDGKGSPKSHLIRGWEKDDDQAIRAINVSMGPVDDLWLPGPLNDRDIVPAPKRVEYQDGRLELPTRIRGTTKWKGGTETVVSIEHKLWPANGVPFGIGAAEHTLRFRVGDVVVGTYDYELEINDFGDGAVSELPNQN